MPRRSQRKKAVTPETVIDSSSENEDFVAVASDDLYVDLGFYFYLFYLLKVSLFNIL